MIIKVTFQRRTLSNEEFKKYGEYAYREEEIETDCDWEGSHDDIREAIRLHIDNHLDRFIPPWTVRGYRQMR